MSLESTGEKLGFVLMFIVSTIILFFILKILGKMPDDWSYFHILILVFIITLIGIFLKRVLK